MNQAAFFIFLLIIVFLFTVGGPGVPEPILHEYKEYLKHEKALLLGSEYFSGYGNLTGFKLSYQDNLDGKNALDWPFRTYTEEHPWKEQQQDSLLPEEFSSKVKSMWGADPAIEDENAYLFNITGEAFGEFDVVTPKTPLKRYWLEMPPALKEFFSQYQREKYEEEWQRYHEDPENNAPPSELDEPSDKNGNITKFNNGDVGLKIYKLSDVSPKLDFGHHGLDLYEGATLLFLDVLLSDKMSSESHEFGQYAVYFHNTGSLVGLTKTAKFRGSIALPQFTLSSENHKKAKILMERLLNSSSSAELTIDDITNTVKAAERLCELVSFFQFKKTGHSLHQLRLIDDELQHPLGMPLNNNVPQLDIETALMYSPDCGLLFERNPEVPFVGDKSAVKFYKIRDALIAMLALSLIEIKVFMRQMRFGSTPTQLSNISSVSIEILSGFDLMTLMLMLLSIWVSDLYLLCASIAIFKGILFYDLESPYRASIDATQMNERGTTWWQILRASGRERHEPAAEEQQDSDLEAQATTADNTPAADAERPTFALQFNFPSNYNRSFFLIIFFTMAFVAFMMLQAVSSNTKLYRVLMIVFLLMLHSFWFPQFLRSTLKNKPNALSWEFLIGVTVLKLIPVAYFTLKKKNPFKKSYDPAIFFAVSGWLGFQLLLLYLQGKLGARFWISSRFLPEQYNYHPIIHTKNIPGGFAQEEPSCAKHNAGLEYSIYTGDCVICMASIQLPVLSTATTDDKKHAGLMDGIMVTPCRHVFHTPCLENWMNYKLQCPVCRSAIPPV